MKHGRPEFNKKVNVCWEVKDEKKCVTLSKEEAYATRDWVEKNNGVIWWWQAVD